MAILFALGAFVPIFCPLFAIECKKLAKEAAGHFTQKGVFLYNASPFVFQFLVTHAYLRISLRRLWP